jgi:hypothetical protein
MCPLPASVTALVQRQLTALDKEQRHGQGQGQGQQKEEKEDVSEAEERESSSGLSVKEKEREEEGGSSDAIMTQMTINEYYPGQGISSHIGE